MKPTIKDQGIKDVMLPPIVTSDHLSDLEAGEPVEKEGPDGGPALPDNPGRRAAQHVVPAHILVERKKNGGKS
jgi:hypothetical protein